MSRRRLLSDERAVSSFSLMAIVLLFFASFTVSYLSYVTNVDSNYRLRMEDISKMESKSQEIVRDLENHAIYTARQSIQENDISGFNDDFDSHVNIMAEEGFDIWLGGDIRTIIDGVYSVIGGTIHENYTVSLAHNAEGYLVKGSFNVTISNLRTDLVLHKVLEFERMIYPDTTSYIMP